MVDGFGDCTDPEGDATPAGVDLVKTTVAVDTDNIVTLRISLGRLLAKQTGDES